MTLATTPTFAGAGVFVCFALANRHADCFPRQIPYHSRRARKSRVTDSADRMVPAATPTDEEDVIDLQLHTRREAPCAALLSLSAFCKERGIESFDVYGDFNCPTSESYLSQFEQDVAAHFGKEDAVFCISGGMAQSIVLLINDATRSKNTGSPAFACHPTSHLLLHENSGYNELMKFESIVLGWDHHESSYDPNIILETSACFRMGPLRLDDVEALVGKEGESRILSHPSRKPDVNVSTLILELPHREIGGKLTPWDEVLEMSNFCSKHNLAFHCDGARIFEASAGYGHASLAETAKPFDSVYISFYKGLGAMSGAMLLGDKPFVDDARVWLRRFGGNIYSVLPYAASAWMGFHMNCLVRDDTFTKRKEKLRSVVKMLTEDSDVCNFLSFDPPDPQTNIVHGYLDASYSEATSAIQKTEDETGIRVLYRLRSYDGGCRFELTMGEANYSIDDELYVKGWKDFVSKIR